MYTVYHGCIQFIFIPIKFPQLVVIIKVNKYFVTGTSNSTTVPLRQNFYNIPTFNMKQLKKAWAKKKNV